MAITMDQLKGLMNTPGLSGRIAINEQGANAQVEKTGIGHFLKTFFGFKSAKAKNEATLNAIRTAFRDDPKLMVGVEFEIGDDRVATMVVEERVVQLRPSDEAESGMNS